MTLWTAARETELRKLFADGLSGSQIAAEMGFAGRNPVVGKLSRLGLVRSDAERKARMSAGGTIGAQAINKRPRPARKTRFYAPPTQPETTPEPVDPPIPFDGKGVTLFELEPWSCRWPIGDPGHPDFSFCDSMSIAGFPYCRSHGRIAYRPQERRRA